ncbi:MAG: thermonuclease family protein [Desulfocapsaceae bacterium]|nr:thermonuclease family protein [Desulfocapsaceae bacterium]
MKYKPLYLFFFILVLIPYISFSATITGKVISVADGDTITILTQQHEQIKIRLSAVDTPEGHQAYGNKAKAFTSFMVKGKNVSIEPETIDKYGRTVAMVFVDGLNLNKEIVANGQGWVYRKYCTASFCDDWLKLEEKARNSKIGLWSDKNPTPPWEWRHGQKNSGNTGVIGSSVNGSAGIYHGNQHSHVFHGSSCRDYNCKNCIVMFGSVNEAVGAGYRAHKECVK